MSAEEPRVVNWSHEESTPRSLEQTPGTTPVPVPYDPGPEREQMRGILATSLLALLAIAILSILALAVSEGFGWTSTSSATLKEVLQQVSQLAVTPLVALVGTALGFYFGRDAAAAGAAAAGK